MSIKFIDVKEAVLKKGKHYMTSDYKTRNKRNHNGIDLIGENRTTDDVIAIEDGEVITSKYSQTAGYYVEIKHQNNYISRYLHLKKGSLKVKVGDIVTKGTILGYMGNTGNSNGAHLHFAIYDNKRVFQDPLPYLLGTKILTNDPFKEFVSNVEASFQTKVDGIPDFETLDKTITVSARINRKHPVVKHLQKYLAYLGYTEVGPVDGIAGPKFTQAIKHFQTDNNCVVDGILTKKNKTWQTLLKLL